MCGPLRASADVIFNLQDSICLSLFMCPGVASRSTFHSDGLSEVYGAPCSSLASTSAFSRSKETPAKHNILNAGK